MAAMDDSWTAWVAENLQRGCDPAELQGILQKHGFAEAVIASSMGARYPGDGGKRPTATDTALNAQFAAPPLVRRSAPGLKREPTTKAQLYIWNGFLDAETCQTLVDIAVAKVRPSTVTRSNGDPLFRTSSTSDLVAADNPDIAAVDEKIARALGVQLAYSEPIQAQKYEFGQEFKAHTDFFSPGTDEYKEHASLRGQRTWTFMIYLNDTPAGGATDFVKLNRKVKPKTGRAVIWNNLNPDGSPNWNTLHHGTPVEEGVKVIITKWFRTKGSGPIFYD